MKPSRITTTCFCYTITLTLFLSNARSEKLFMSSRRAAATLCDRQSNLDCVFVSDDLLDENADGDLSDIGADKAKSGENLRHPFARMWIDKRANFMPSSENYKYEKLQSRPRFNFDNKRTNKFFSWGGKRDDGVANEKKYYGSIRKQAFVTKGGKRMQKFFNWGGKRSVDDREAFMTDQIDYNHDIMKRYIRQSLNKPIIVIKQHH